MSLLLGGKHRLSDARISDHGHFRPLGEHSGQALHVDPIYIGEAAFASYGARLVKTG
jgi:hypothetical protein